VSVIAGVIGGIRHGRRIVVLNIDIPGKVTVVVLAKHDEFYVFPWPGSIPGDVLVKCVEIAAAPAVGVIVINQVIVGARIRKAALQEIGLMRARMERSSAKQRASCAFWNLVIAVWTVSKIIVEMRSIMMRNSIRVAPAVLVHRFLRGWIPTCKAPPVMRPCCLRSHHTGTSLALTRGRATESRNTQLTVYRASRVPLSLRTGCKTAVHLGGHESGHVPARARER